MIRVGITGVGNTVSIAHKHALGYLGDGRCSISAVYDINKANAEKFVHNHNLNAVVTSSYEELMDMVDAVSICTPNAFHYTYGVQALQAGKHVLMEKPMGIGKEECMNLALIARTSKGKSALGFVYRFSDVVQKTKEIVKTNFSSIYTISGWFGGRRLADPTLPFEWRMDKRKSGSGALGDFSSHLVDIVHYVTGLKLDSISASLGIFIKERPNGDGKRKVENDDAAAFVAKAGDSLIQFTVSRVGLDDVCMLISGDGGMIELSTRTGGFLKYWPKERKGPYFGETKDIPIIPQLTFDDWFRLEIPAFLDRIEGKPSEIADFDDGYYTEKVIDAALKSTISGRIENL